MDFTTIINDYNRNFYTQKEKLNNNIQILLIDKLKSIRNNIKTDIICGNGTFTYRYEPIHATYDDGSTFVFKSPHSLRDYIEYDKLFKLDIPNYVFEILMEINAIVTYWVQETGGGDITIKDKNENSKRY